MDSEYTGKQQVPCQCELCQPNWHLGQSGDFEAVPESELAVEHASKIVRGSLRSNLVVMPERALN